jgi:hypothetical protein
MAVAVKSAPHQRTDKVNTDAARLRELREQAAEIRLQHERGEISADETSDRLRRLKSGYSTFFERFI